LRPLAEAFAGRFKAFLPKLSYPVRTGAHPNTAFALTLALDYAEVREGAGLRGMIHARAPDWFASDADAQAWEPSGEDFLSPTLMQAHLLSRILTPAAFAYWFEAFMPRLAEGQPATLFRPAEVSDRSDGKIAHLDGLNLSRAWNWRALAGALPAADARRPVMLEAADRHIEASLGAVAGDYMGEHWLASFALLALTA
jgi:hypothetical protein